MGFVLDVDLETSEGPSHEVYVRIESLSFNKVTSKVQFQLTYWQDRDQAIRFNRTLLSEPKKNAIGLIQERVLYFSDDLSDGKEILLPHHLVTYLTSKREIEVPVYEVQTVEKEVPFVSFDENGDEVIKHRTITKEEKVQVGTEKQYEDVIDGTLAGDLYGFCYKHIKATLSEWFPIDKIITIK